MAALPAGSLPGTAGYPLQWTPHLQGLLCGRPHTSGDPARQTPHRCEGGALDSVPLGLRAAVVGVRQPMLSSCANWSQAAEGCPRGRPQARTSAGTQDVRGPSCPAQTGGAGRSQEAGSLPPPTPPASRLSPALGQPGVGPASPLPRWPRERARQWCQPVSWSVLCVRLGACSTASLQRATGVTTTRAKRSLEQRT